MKKIVFALLTVFLLTGAAHAADIAMPVSVTFKNPFQVSDITLASFGEILLDGDERTIAMDINALTATAAAKAAAISEATDQGKLVKVTSDGTIITPGGTVNAGHVVIQASLATLNLQLECAELPSGAVTDTTAMSGDYDISGGSGKVVIKSVYTNLDDINALNAFTVGGTDSMPLYFAPSMDVKSPEFVEYTGTLNFTLTLQ